MSSQEQNTDTHDLPPNVFRASVGAVLVNNGGQVLAFERIGMPGAWQLPQGGLRENEEPETAIIREIKEETGITESFLTRLAEYPEWLVYELDKAKRTGKYGRGQAQKWYLFRFVGQDTNIQLKKTQDAEFSAWKWTTLASLANETASFRQPIYRKLNSQFSEYLKPTS